LIFDMFGSPQNSAGCGIGADNSGLGAAQQRDSLAWARGAARAISSQMDSFGDSEIARTQNE
jgi:hypothetical protein